MLKERSHLVFEKINTFQGAWHSYIKIQLRHQFAPLF